MNRKINVRKHKDKREGKIALQATLAAKIVKGDEFAAAQLITMIENGHPGTCIELSELFLQSGTAHLIGLTGPSGSGKSTIGGRLGVAMSNIGYKVAIIAVDPSNMKGGALLGDRTRMRLAEETGDLFIRSMADRGNPGGLCTAVRGVEYVLEALGKGIIIVESIGAGQSDRGILLVADTVITLLTPDYGDEIQLMKAGLHNIGDIVVMNKGDLDGADEAYEMISFFVKNMKQKIDDWTVPVIRVECINGDGIDKLLDAINQHKQFLDKNNKGSNRTEKDVQLMLSIVKEKLWNCFEEKWSNDPNIIKIIQDVRNARIDPYSAVQRLLNMLDVELSLAGDSGIEKDFRK